MTSSADATATTSVDLSTRYLGLALPHPFMPGASPMVDDLDLVRRLEDAGAAAIVMHSLFEEQIEMEQGRTRYDIDSTAIRGKVIDYARNETRFRIVEQQDPARFRELMHMLQRKSEERRALYDHMALPFEATPQPTAE